MSKFQYGKPSIYFSLGTIFPSMYIELNRTESEEMNSTVSTFSRLNYPLWLTKHHCKQQ